MTEYAKAETLVVDDIESWHGYTLNSDGDWDEPTIVTGEIYSLKEDTMDGCRPDAQGLCRCDPWMYRSNPQMVRSFTQMFSDFTLDPDLRF